MPAASTDPLTGFLTRPALAERIDALAAANGLDGLRVLSVEISRFGHLNDSVGAALGDRILARVATRLRAIFPNALAMGRMHGDQVALVLPSSVEPEAAVATLSDFAQRPLALQGRIIVLSIRVGMADAATSGANAAGDLLHAAEVALHRAKVTGRRSASYEPGMVAEARAQHDLENDLRVALVTNAAELHAAVAGDEFLLHYQPIVASSTGALSGFEALLRWHHPRTGVVQPDQFIPMAEQIRIMDVLGAWVLRTALAEAAQWPRGPSGVAPKVSVNLSPTQFDEPDVLVRAVEVALDESGIEPARVCLEVTETGLMGPSSITTLERLRALGCGISLDDFGAGFSSLAQLVALPLDYLKIDRVFVRGWRSPDPSEAQRFEKLTRSILALARALELTTITEGVESDDEIRRVRAQGGDLVQGFVYARPMPPGDARAFMASWNEEVRS